ncbi:AAA family ATPase [Tropicimonas sp.]|uniref:AAA family ATPase n=1 Tax=Tropicimonas sp. TaxID=2067044 RepID=UPI003A887B45
MLTEILGALDGGHRTIVLIGALGIGKSTLLQRVAAEIGPRFNVGLVWNSELFTHGVYETLCATFEVTAEPRDKNAYRAAFLACVAEHDTQQKRTVLIVDEAQKLDVSLLDRLVGLAARTPGLSLVLAGQSTLADKLIRCTHRADGPILEMPPMTAAETEAYIHHRLAQVGGSPDLLGPGVARVIHTASAGFPREVNRICDLCLLVAANRSLPRVGPDLVQTVVEATEFTDIVAGLRPSQSLAGPAPATPLRIAQPASAVFRQAGPAGIKAATTGVARPDAGTAEPHPLELTDRLETPASARPAPASTAPSAPFPARRRRLSLPATLAGAALSTTLAIGFLMLEPAITLPAFFGAPGENTGIGAIWRSLVGGTGPRQDHPRPLTELVREGTGPLPAGADARFRLAVQIAGQSPQASVAAYSHAALLGHSRAAYYLGQIFESGDGVPKDKALANAWYNAAAKDVRLAGSALASVERPVRGDVAAPIPLSDSIGGDGRAELVWTSGNGPDPHEYRVEFAGAAPGRAIDAGTYIRSAARIVLPDGATRWRVVALDSTGRRAAASDWQDLHRN